MKVLSLFDGIGGGALALKSAGFSDFEYHSSEIDKFGIQVSGTKNPESIQLGDVTKVKGGDYDLVLAGSPCQGFSYAGRGLNFADPRSSLFFEFVRILNETRAINPNVKFFLENVNMRDSWRDQITTILGVEPLKVCASTVTPFKRNRCYWFDWEKPPFPESSCGGFFELTGGLPCSIVGRPLDPSGNRRDGKGFPTVQCIEFSVGDSGRCVTTVSKDSCVYTSPPYLLAGRGRIPDAYGSSRGLWRDLTIEELEAGHGYPKGYFNGFSESSARKAIGNGWSLPVVERIFGNIRTI